MDNLDVRHELLGEVPHRARWDLDSVVVVAGQLSLDLADLAAFEKPGKSNSDKDVVSDVCTPRDDAIELPGASRREARVRWTVPFSLGGAEFPVEEGYYTTTPGHSNMKPAVAFRAGILVVGPVESEARCGEHSFFCAMSDVLLLPE